MAGHSKSYSGVENNTFSEAYQPRYLQTGHEPYSPHLPTLIKSDKNNENLDKQSTNRSSTDSASQDIMEIQPSINIVESLASNLKRELVSELEPLEFREERGDIKRFGEPDNDAEKKGIEQQDRDDDQRETSNKILSRISKSRKEVQARSDIRKVFKETSTSPIAGSSRSQFHESVGVKDDSVKIGGLTMKDIISRASGSHGRSQGLEELLPAYHLNENDHNSKIPRTRISLKQDTSYLGRLESNYKVPMTLRYDGSREENSLNSRTNSKIFSQPPPPAYFPKRDLK